VTVTQQNPKKGSPLRTALLVLVILGVLAIPIFLFGERFEDMLDGQRALAFVRAQGPWGAIVAIALIMADLVVPLPAPAIMAALGLIYGPVLGGLYASAGSFCAALLGYGLCRLIGPRAAAWIAGPREVERVSGFFEAHGMWAIAFSRFLPAVPEVLACLAGLTRMPFQRFFLGNLLGSIAVGFTYAYLGAQGEDDPAAALGWAVVLPFAAVPIFFILIARRRKSPPALPKAPVAPQAKR